MVKTIYGTLDIDSVVKRDVQERNEPLHVVITLLSATEKQQCT